MSESSEESILLAPAEKRIKIMHSKNAAPTASDASMGSLEHDGEAPFELFLERSASYEPPETLYLPRLPIRLPSDSPQSANMSTTDGMPEARALPPRLLPGLSQSSYSASLGASFVGLSQPLNERETNRVAAASKEAIDTATYNDRCDSPMPAAPPVLYRQRAFRDEKQ